MGRGGTALFVVVLVVAGIGATTVGSDATTVGAGDATALAIDGDEWARTYESPREWGVFHDALALDSGALLVGTAVNDSADDRYDGWLVRVDDGGSVVWEGTLSERRSGVFTSVVPATDGVYAGGSLVTAETPFTGQLVRLTDRGEVVWVRTRPYSQVVALATTPDGGVVAAGTGTVERIAPNGSAVWQRRDLNGSVRAATRLDDRYLLVGYVGDGPDRDAWLAVLEPDGTVARERRLNRSGGDRLSAATTHGGTAYAAGWTAEDDDDWRTMFAVRIDADGEVAWVDTVGPLNTDAAAEAATVLPGGDPVLAGEFSTGGGALRISPAGDTETLRRGGDSFTGIDATGERVLVAGKQGERGYAALVSTASSGEIQPRTDEPADPGSGGSAVADSGGDTGGGPPDISPTGLSGLAPVLYAVTGLAVFAALGVTALALRDL